MDSASLPTVDFIFHRNDSDVKVDFELEFFYIFISVEKVLVAKFFNLSKKTMVSVLTQFETALYRSNPSFFLMTEVSIMQGSIRM